MFKFYSYIISLVLLSTFSLHAQTESLVDKCSSYFTKDYVSDGQHYTSKVKNSEPVVFQTTFFNETTYRVAAATDTKDTQVILEVFDTEKNLLFSNKNHKYSPFWDFKFKSTVDCIIEVKIVPEERITKGLAMVLIGFKPN